MYETVEENPHNLLQNRGMQKKVGWGCYLRTN